MPATLSNTHDLSSILQRLERLAADAHDRKGLWGTMTLHQMICHCADQLRFATGEKSGKDISNIFFRTIGKWVILHTGLGFPRNTPTLPELDVVSGSGSQPTEFLHDIEALRTLIHKVADSNTHLATAHPAFGSATSEEWRRLAWLHLDHHFRQFGA
jgi:hypothetical protein